MVMGLKSPYSDDETRVKDVAKILEGWIETEWNDARAGVPKSSILFGKKQEDMQTFNKEITLRCYAFYTNRNIPYDWSRNRKCYIDSVNIDVWVLNNEDMSGYDPRAIKIWKYLEEFIEIREGQDYKGIYEMRLINGGLKPQPEMRNLTNPVITVEITYFADKVNII